MSLVCGPFVPPSVRRHRLLPSCLIRLLYRLSICVFICSSSEIRSAFPGLFARVAFRHFVVRSPPPSPSIARQILAAYSLYRRFRYLRSLLPLSFPSLSLARASTTFCSYLYFAIALRPRPRSIKERLRKLAYADP